MVRLMLALVQPALLNHIDRGREDISEDEHSVLTLKRWLEQPTESHWDGVTKLPPWEGADSVYEAAAWLAQGRAKALGEQKVCEVICGQVVPWVLHAPTRLDDSSAVGSE